MQLVKGQRVRHPGLPAWGIGEVLEDCGSEKVSIRFEGAGKKILSLTHVNLVVVEGNEAKSPVLDNRDEMSMIDLHKVNGLCEQFISLMKDHRKGFNDAGVAEDIMSDLKKFGRLRAASKKRLGEWCTSGGAFNEGVPLAQAISMEIFGRIIRRE